ncbi:hypothetical protein D3C86_1705320 [compost metagenome]
MDPHVSNVFGSDVISIPFVPAFVDNDEIPFQPDSGITQIGSQVTVHETVSVCYGTLVFHSQVRCFHQFVTIFVKRVGAEPVFQCFQCFRGILELFFCFFFVSS